MKRKQKNILMISLIILTCGSMIFTMNYAKNNTTTSQSMPSMSENGGTPPSQQNNDNSQSSSDQGTPPAMPGNDNSSNSGQSDNSSSNNQSNNDSSTNNQNNSSDSTNSQNNNSTPPAKPSDDNNSQQGQSSDNSNSQGQAPSGDNSQGQGPGNSQGQAPGGNSSQGTPPDMNQSSSQSISTVYYVIFGVESLVVSGLAIYLIMSKMNQKTFKETFKNTDKILIGALSVVVLTTGLTCADSVITNKFLLNQNAQVQENNAQGSTSSSVVYSGVKEITEDTTISEGTFESTDSDQNAILVSGDQSSTLTGITVNKTGDSDGGDSTSFYGNNSGILAKDGANLTLKNITVTTDATGANGVFSYGGSATTSNSSSDGTTVTISDSTITTKKDNSGGIMTTGGGIMKASNLTVNTAGTSSAAIRTDRGGGTVTVDGGTYTTTGQGSPAIYSTADVTVSNAKLISKASEGVVIEGKNKVTLNNVTLTDTNTKLNGQSTTYKNIFLYQSMSGDADNGTAEFTSKDGTITTNKGDTFYVTNTSATINLTNNTITNNDSTGYFLRAQKDSWGNSGSNGGDVTLNMTSQTATGDIYIDSISTLDMTLSSSSSYEGTINGDNTAKSIKLTLDKSSKIKLTGDCYITSLDNADSTNSNIDFNGYTLYVNGKAIN